MATRRNILHWLRAGAAAGSLANLLRGETTAPDELPQVHAKKKLKVIFVGAHVDDWVDCAGALARYTQLGHEALCISFTPGDSQSMAEQRHMTVEELAAARRAHATKASAMIGARMMFLNQHNQNMRVDPGTYAEFSRTLIGLQPDVVFGMWPLEFHPDHRAAANLAYHAWLQSGMRFSFFFCETAGGREMQAQQFLPNRYIDVASVADLKRRSYVANEFIRSGWDDAETWAKFRGMQYGCKYAEAFVQVSTVATMQPANLYPNRWRQGGLRLKEN